MENYLFFFSDFFRFYYHKPEKPWYYWLCAGSKNGGKVVFFYYHITQPNRKDKTMERYDRNRIHSESMEFVGLIADKVNTIKHAYGLSEQTAIEICKLSATLYDSYKDTERLDRQSESAKRVQDGLESVGSAIWQTN